MQKNKLLFTFFLACAVGCSKFLDEKPNDSDIVPSKLDELQTLLDNAQGVMNSSGTGGYCELISDNIFVEAGAWQQYASVTGPVFQSETQNYIWGDLPHDHYWGQPYTGPIHYANIVKDQLEILGSQGDEEKYNELYGAALFYRAFAFLGLAQLYCKPYASQHFNSPGIILRETSNVSEKTPRSTVLQTYERIVADLKLAARMLPATTAYATRPTKRAAYAALARTFLFMRKYEEAREYADYVLKENGALMDFNTVTLSIPSLNPEVIFHNYSSEFILLYNHRIDSVLYNSYHVNDLRRKIYFSANSGPDAGTFSFQGSYNGYQDPKGLFDGLTTGEMYLVRAECAARDGNKEAALWDLNTLVEKRWEQGKWLPIKATDAVDALNKILDQRRKELVFRGLRWPDIRRFNLEERYVSVRRIIGNDTFTLPPNSPRSVMLIPWQEIENNPGVVQNER